MNLLISVFVKLEKDPRKRGYDIKFQFIGQISTWKKKKIPSFIFLFYSGQQINNL